MIKKVLLSLFLCLLSILPATSQRIDQLLDELNYVDGFPSDLLSTKSLVLIDVPLKQKNPPIRADWKTIAQKVQPALKRAGIDGVSYFNVDDIYSSSDATSAFFGQFMDRGLNNLVLVQFAKEQYSIIIAGISDPVTLIKPGKNAWKSSGPELEPLLQQMYLRTANAGLKRTNLLILEVPTYGSMPEIIEGRRGEYYDVNFSSEKLAVPAFADTAQIHLFMQEYPYEYEIVDSNLTERELREMGYPYVFKHVHTTSRNARKLLGYKDNENETAFVSEYYINGKPQAQSIGATTEIYKFYIKHIFSQNVFLGTKWDADITWSGAMRNYVSNLRKQLIN